ncbi:TrbG/VirB9 family P-type conjugative transfer protein [Ramlibacter sp. AN1133]|uniref:TrbG/VirB9 family P-type conjugative transfer protein n=1 Tax=Ramlibacter sp. AN1133 TaxID=3133429 RepID=UPI0030C0ADA5
MKSRLAISSLALALLTSPLAPARGADPARVGAYDFGYLLSGDVRVRPVQVFDDGSSTYFQFRAGEAVPAIFAAAGGVPHLLIPVQEGPYVRIAQVHGRFLLQVGRAQADVIHAGAQRPDAPQVMTVAESGLRQPYGATPLPARGRLVASLAPVAMELDAPQALDRNSYATPVKGDRVFWPERPATTEHSVGFARAAYGLSRDALRSLQRLAQAAPGVARFTVIGRDDDSYKEGLDRARAQAIRSALMKAGIASDRITLRTGVMKPPARAKLWDSTVVVEVEQAAPAMSQAGAPAKLGTAAANPALAAHLEALVRAGVLDPAQARAVLAGSRQGQESPSPGAAVAAAGAQKFAMRKTDEFVDRMLTRWARECGWRVIWQGAPAIAITGDAEIDRPDFLQAADLVVKHAKAAGYRIAATAYRDQVLQIVSE